MCSSLSTGTGGKIMAPEMENNASLFFLKFCEANDGVSYTKFGEENGASEDRSIKA